MDSPFSISTASTSTLILDAVATTSTSKSPEGQRTTPMNRHNLTIGLPPSLHPLSAATAAATAKMSGRGFVEPHHSHLPRRRPSNRVPMVGRYGGGDSSESSDEGAAAAAEDTNPTPPPPPLSLPSAPTDPAAAEAARDFDSNKTESGFGGSSLAVSKDTPMIAGATRSYALRRMLGDDGTSLSDATPPPQPLFSSPPQPHTSTLTAQFLQPHISNLPRRHTRRVSRDSMLGNAALESRSPLARVRAPGGRRGLSVDVSSERRGGSSSTGYARRNFSAEPTLRRPHPFSFDEEGEARRRRPARGLSSHAEEVHPRLDSRRRRRKPVAETMKLQEVGAGVWVGVEEDLVFASARCRWDGIFVSSQKRIAGVIRVVSKAAAPGLGDSSSEESEGGLERCNPAIRIGRRRGSRRSSGGGGGGDSDSDNPFDVRPSGMREASRSHEPEVLTLEIANDAGKEGAERGCTRLSVEQMKEGCLFARRRKQILSSSPPQLIYAGDSGRSRRSGNSDNGDAQDGDDDEEDGEDNQAECVVLVLASNEDAMVDAMSMALCLSVLDELSATAPTGQPDPGSSLRTQHQAAAQPEDDDADRPSSYVPIEGGLDERREGGMKEGLGNNELGVMMELDAALVAAPTEHLLVGDTVAPPEMTCRPDTDSTTLEVPPTHDADPSTPPTPVCALTPVPAPFQEYNNCNHGVEESGSTNEVATPASIPLIDSKSEAGPSPVHTPHLDGDATAEGGGGGGGGLGPAEYTAVHRMLWRLHDEYVVVVVPTIYDEAVSVDINVVDTDDPTSALALAPAPSPPYRFPPLASNNNNDDDDCKAPADNGTGKGKGGDSGGRRFCVNVVDPATAAQHAPSSAAARVALREEWRGLVGFEGAWKVWSAVELVMRDDAEKAGSDTATMALC